MAKPTWKESDCNFLSNSTWRKAIFLRIQEQDGWCVMWKLHVEYAKRQKCNHIYDCHCPHSPLSSCKHLFGLCWPATFLAPKFLIQLLSDKYSMSVSSGYFLISVFSGSHLGCFLINVSWFWFFKSARAGARRWLMKSACWFVHVLGKKRQKWGGNRINVLTGRTQGAEHYV